MPARRRSKRRLVWLALKTHGPMCDDQLCWWLGHFGVAAGTVCKLRRRLTQEGLVRFARRFTRTRANRWAQMWEAVGQR